MQQIWSYIINDDDTITITGYKGNATEVYVPEQIGQKRVVKIEGFAFSPDAPYIHNATRQKRRGIEKISIPAGISYTPTIDDVPKNLKALECPDCTIDSVFMPGSTERGRRCYVHRLHLQDLSEIKPMDEASRYCFKGGILYNKEMTELYFWLRAVKLDNLIVPDTVQRICGGALDCGTFNSIIIPDSVKEIGTYALYACEAHRLVFGGGIPEPSTDIFGWSTISSMPCLMSYEEIEFKEGVTHLPQCFAKMKELKRVTLPASVTFFPDKCFYYRPDIRTQFFDYLERGEPVDMVLVVPHGSYAEKYAKDYGYTIEYSD